MKKLSQTKHGSSHLDAEIALATGVYLYQPKQKAIWDMREAPPRLVVQAADVKAEFDPVRALAGCLSVPAFTTSLDAAVTLYKTKPDHVPSNPIQACIEGLAQHANLAA